MHQLPLFNTSAQTSVNSDSASMLKSSTSASSASQTDRPSRDQGFGWLLSSAHEQLESGNATSALSPYQNPDKRQGLQEFAAQGGQTLPPGAILGSRYFDGAHSGSEKTFGMHQLGLKTNDEWASFQEGLPTASPNTLQLTGQLNALLAKFDKALAEGDAAAVSDIEIPKQLSALFNELSQGNVQGAELDLSGETPLMADLQILASMVVEALSAETNASSKASSTFDLSALGSNTTLADGSALSDLLERLQDGIDQGTLSPQLANFVQGAFATPGQANALGLGARSHSAPGGSLLNANAAANQGPLGVSATGTVAGELGLNPDGAGQSSNQDTRANQYSNFGAQYRSESGAYGANAAGAELVSESDKSFKQSFDALGANLLAEVGAESADELAKVDQAAAKVNELSARAAQNLKPYTTTVHSQLNDQAWPDEMTEKVMFLASKNIQNAQIHMNPVELGPIEVKISVQNEQTVVNFNVQNANVREMLEANVHRLREMMDGNGVNLADVNVGSESSSEGFSGFDDQGAFAQQSGDADGEEGVIEEGVAQVADLGNVSLIDERV